MLERPLQSKSVLSANWRRYQCLPTRKNALHLIFLIDILQRTSVIRTPFWPFFSVVLPENKKFFKSLSLYIVSDLTPPSIVFANGIRSWLRFWLNASYQHCILALCAESKQLATLWFIFNLALRTGGRIAKQCGNIVIRRTLYAVRETLHPTQLSHFPFWYRNTEKCWSLYSDVI